MPSNKGFDNQEEKLMSDTAEKSPGVYVRTGEYEPHELDMLWSGTRHFGKEERSPIIFVAVGLIIGVVITAALFSLLFSKPQITTGENELTAPIVNETELLQKTEVIPAAPEVMPATETTPVSAPAAATSGTQTYVVKSGDTLESIARRFYGSGTPAMIRKIQQANAMNNPDALQIDQKLVIPPRSY